MYLCRTKPINLIKSLLFIPICLWVLPACGPLPKPFKANSDVSVALLGTIMEAHQVVLVGPILGFNEEISKEIELNLHPALAIYGIASKKQNPQPSSFVITVVLDSSRMMMWKLLDSERVIVLQFEKQPFVSKNDVIYGIDQVVRRVALYFAQQRGSRDSHGPRISVMPIDGAPTGDKGLLLTDMQLELSQNGYRSFGSIYDADYILLGSINITDFNSIEKRHMVYIDWTVILPDGTRVGSVTQENDVWRHDIQEKWGNITRSIAKSSVPGVVQLLKQYNSK